MAYWATYVARVSDGSRQLARHIGARLLERRVSRAGRRGAFGALVKDTTSAVVRDTRLRKN